MGRECSICGKRTIFFIWGLSRVMSERANNLILNKYMRYIDSLDVICMYCCRKYNLLNKRKEKATWDEMRR